MNPTVVGKAVTHVSLAHRRPSAGADPSEPGSVMSCTNSLSLYFSEKYDNFFKRFYLFLEGGGKRGKHQYVVVSFAPPTGDLACNPGMCPDWELNQ